MLDVRTEVGPAGNGWVTADAFFSDQASVAEFLAFERSRHLGTDPMTSGALLMADYGYIAAAAVIPLFAGFGILPSLSPASFALFFYTTEEAHEGRTHKARCAHVRLLDGTFRSGRVDDADDGEWLRSEIERHFRPVVEVVHARTHLSRAALWRLAADAIAGRFLDAGRRFGTVEASKAAALRILKVPGSPLANRQLHFFDLTVLDRERRDFSYTFQQRSGCCRLYRVEGGEYCSTCVLKAPAERDEDLRLACVVTSALTEQ